MIFNKTQSSDLLFPNFDVEKAAKITKEQRKSLRFEAFESAINQLEIYYCANQFYPIFQCIFLKF